MRYIGRHRMDPKKAPARILESQSTVVIMSMSARAIRILRRCPLKTIASDSNNSMMRFGHSTSAATFAIVQGNLLNSTSLAFRVVSSRFTYSLKPRFLRGNCLKNLISWKLSRLSKRSRISSI